MGDLEKIMKLKSEIDELEKIHSQEIIEQVKMFILDSYQQKQVE